VSIGKTVLGKTGEAARKLRQSARFMIGCIDELPAARVAPYASLGALDRYTLGLVSAHARTVTDAYEQLDFKGVFALSVSFNAVQLSAFLFDHAKDRLYADKADSDARRNVQTVLLHALVVFTKSLAPIAPHFAEEIYQHVPLQLRPLFRDESINDGTATPAAAEQEAEDSLFMHGWLSSACSPAWVDDELAASVESARRVRSHVTKLLERVRQGQCQSASAAQQGNVKLGSFSEAEVTLELAGSSTLYRDLAERLGSQELNTLLTTARTHIVALAEPLPVPEAGSAADSASSSSSSADGGAGASFEELVSEAGSDGQLTGLRIRFAPAKGSKCPRCRLFTEDATEEEPCCARCRAVLQELATAQ
jgi:isoleucyl-tRNA synthetase